MARIGLLCKKTGCLKILHNYTVLCLRDGYSMMFSPVYFLRISEVETLRTHFEVLGLGLEGQVFGLGLEASSPRKLSILRLEDSTIF